MEIENLWPEDIFNKKIILPKKILLEQAHFLSEMSGNVLVADIKSKTGIRNVTANRQVSILIHEFVLKAPSLGNYQVKLFHISHEEIAIYPFTLSFSLVSTNYTIGDENHLRQVLKEVFSNEKTRNVIAYLMSQSEM